MYFTAVNTDSNLEACPSPTYGAQIMSNDALLRTSDFHSLSQISNYQQHLYHDSHFPMNPSTELR